MNRLLYLLLFLLTISINGQVGINTETPETTLDVVGKPNDVNQFDGIIPPRITGTQLAAKSYSFAKKGAIILVSEPPTNLSGQVINVTESGLYYFDGDLWQAISKEVQPVEYRILLTFDPNSTSNLTATSAWSAPVNYSGNSFAYLTALKYYTVGTKNFGGLEGSVLFRKIQGIVNVLFQIYRSNNSEPIVSDAFINIGNVYRDIGYIPNQIVLLHTENSPKYFPALLENYAIQIPQTSLNLMSKTYYTYGEIQGYSAWIKPYLP